MKKIIIALIVIVALVLIWKGIQIKPDVNVPQASVSDTTTQQTTPVTTSTTTSTVTTTTEIKTPLLGSTKQVDNSKVAIEFTGFGPGKKHLGSFSDIRSNLKTDASSGLSGDITVGMASLTSDSDKLVTDLKSANFFDVAKYSTAKFTVKSFSHPSGCDTTELCLPTMTGTMNIHGITKNISFPIISTAENYQATFNINMKEFGIDQKFANEVIELRVTVPLK